MTSLKGAGLDWRISVPFKEEVSDLVMVELLINDYTFVLFILY